jgi:putative ABC transport system permease protein
MFTMTLKELAARKLRLLSTALAVLLGVAFMAGTLVFTDTIGATFDSVLADANEGVDVYVRTPSPIDLGYGEPGPRLDASLVDRISAVDGVSQTAVVINGYAQIVGPDGGPVGDLAKHPAFAANWVSVPDLNPYTLVTGSAPAHAGEIVIDKATADSTGYRPGDVATVLTQRAPRELTISGVATFGEADSPAGATAVLFSDAAAEELLASPGEADAIAITADDGTDPADLAARVQSAVGGQVEAITGATLVAENQASIAADIAMFSTIMVIFALVAVFVGAFIINNTFSITIAQRTREMAMLRAIGASGRQVQRSVLIEAAAIGLLASGVGLVAGIGVASGLRAVMGQFGFELPDGPTVISSSAMVISLVVGVAVTMLSAWLPARRAARIRPIAALRDISVDRSARSGRRAVVGTLISAVGVATLTAGLSGELLLVGVGALGIFIGVSVLAPVLANPFARWFGVVLTARGPSGEMATRNATRNPKRMARTASSLMIGVALVGFITVFAASAKSSIAGSLETEFVGTHIVQTGAYDNTAGISPRLADQLRRHRDVDVVAQARLSPAVVDGEPTDALDAFDGSSIDEVFVLGRVEGNLDGLGADGIAVSADEAESRGWVIGSTVPVTFPTGATTLVVEAIYSGATDWVGSVFVDLAAFEANGVAELDHKLYVVGDETAITATAAAYPTADVLDADAFLADTSAEIDTMLGLFYALLGLAVVIALLGIANTLALSIFERTREIGLLRAVGMSRSQVRSTIRWESIIIAVFGTTLGLAIGTFFGWATVRAMAGEGIDTLTIPVTELLVVATIAAFAGALAAIVPARRAARLQVLEALTTD